MKPTAVLLLVLGGFSLIWIRTKVMEAKYEIGSLESARGAALIEQKKLISDRSRLSSPVRVAAVAAEKLGLELPSRADVYVVRYDPSSNIVRAKGVYKRRHVQASDYAGVNREL
ncbi:MAG: cell division protein FtsL [Nitrospirae bacterium]|nr:cell division protein FtsL [Nitrospirota bacterium]